MLPVFGYLITCVMCRLVGAKWSRDILARVLCESYDNGDLTLEEAIAAAELILNRNAIEFYKLEGNSRAPFSSLARSHSTESLLRLQESLAPPLTIEKPPSSFEFRLPGRSPHPNGSAHPNSKDVYNEANPTPKFGPAPQFVPRATAATSLAPVAPVAPVALVTAVPEVVVPVAVIAVDEKPLEVKRVRLLYADTSGQLRCRVCLPLLVNQNLRINQMRVGISNIKYG